MIRKFFIFLLSFFFVHRVMAELSLVDLEKDDPPILRENFIKNQNPDRFVNGTQIRILNKDTGKSFDLKKKIGERISVEDLDIEFLKCWKSYPEETPENKLLLKVYENSNGHSAKEHVIFFGWIFSSSPSLNGIEHPLYDITLENCKNE